MRYDYDLPSVELCQRLFDTTGAFVVPGAAFDWEGWFRLGYAFDAKRLTDGLGAISRFLRTLEGLSGATGSPPTSTPRQSASGAVYRHRMLVADLLLVSIGVVWGFNFVVIKDAIGRVDPMLYVMLRYLVAVGDLRRPRAAQRDAREAAATG